MSNDGQIAERWRKRPPPLPSEGGIRRSLPDRDTILLMEVKWVFWELLVFERSGMVAEARIARGACLKAAKALRRRLDVHPEAGPEVADAMIAWQVHFARKAFAEDLERGSWRRRPGERRFYS